MKRELRVDCTLRSRLHLPIDIKKYLKDEHILQYFLSPDSLNSSNSVGDDFLTYIKVSASLSMFYIQFICTGKYN